jgi:hypothetical protein
MVIGLAMTFLGVVVVWFGLTEDVSVQMDAPKLKGKLAGAGPGALLVICGTALILMCIHKEFRIEDTTPIPDITNSTQSKPN